MKQHEAPCFFGAQGPDTASYVASWGFQHEEASETGCALPNTNMILVDIIIFVDDSSVFCWLIRIIDC